MLQRHWHISVEDSVDKCVLIPYSMIAHKQHLVPSLLNDMHHGWQLGLVYLVRKLLPVLVENVAVMQELAICPMTVF